MFARTNFLYVVLSIATMRHPELAEVFVRELASRAKTNDRSRRRMEAGIYKGLRLAFCRKSNIFLGKPTKVVTRSLPRPTVGRSRRFASFGKASPQQTSVRLCEPYSG